MPEVLAGIGIVVAIAAAMVGLALLATRARRRGTAGSAIAGAMAAYDEGMHGTAHDAFVEVAEQERRPVPIEGREN